MVINLFKKETGGNKKKLVDPNITQEDLTDTGIPKLLKEKSAENVEMTKAQFVLPNNANQNFKKNNNEKEKIEARIIEESLVKPTNKLVQKIEDDKGVQQDIQNITKEVSNKEVVRKNISISKKEIGETNIPQKEKIEARIIEESLVKPTNKLVQKIEDDKGVQQDIQNITKEVSNKEVVRKNISISKKEIGETNIPQKEKIEARIIEESLVKPTDKLVQKIEDDKGVQQDIQNITKEVSNKEVVRKNISISKKEIGETSMPQKGETEARIIEESLVKPTNRVIQKTKKIKKVKNDEEIQQNIQKITKQKDNQGELKKNIAIPKKRRCENKYRTRKERRSNYQ